HWCHRTRCASKERRCHQTPAASATARLTDSGLRPRRRGEAMHALLVTADVEPGREDEGLEYLRAMLPDLQQIPGLLSGYWLATTKDGESLAIVIFEDEAAAKDMAEIGLPNAPQPPGATFRRAEEREVVARIYAAYGTAK